jgi:hypothetical protein
MLQARGEALQISHPYNMCKYLHISGERESSNSVLVYTHFRIRFPSQSN